MPEVAQLPNPSISTDHEDATSPFQISLETAMMVIEEQSTPEERLQFAGWRLSGSHVRHRQNQEIAQICGVSIPTANNWLSGDAACSKEFRIWMRLRASYKSEIELIRDYVSWLGRDIFAAKSR